MTDPLETIGYIQNGKLYHYLDDVDWRSTYFTLRSDGSVIRDMSYGTGPMPSARVSAFPDPVGLGGQQSTADRPDVGQPLTGQAVAGIKNYLNRVYGLANVQDSQAWSWLERVTRIDDATADHESFNERLIQDVYQNEGGGDPVSTEAVLKQVLGEEGWDQLVASSSGSSGSGTGSGVNADLVNLTPEERAQLAGGVHDVLATALQKIGIPIMPIYGARKAAAEAGSGAGTGAGAAGAGGNYTIQPGDTLSELAARFGTTVEALAAANGIADPNSIVAGAKLTIPGASGAGTGAAAAGAVAPAGAGPGGGIAADLSGGPAGPGPGAAAGAPAGSASAGSGIGTGIDYSNKTAGTGPGGQEVTPELLQEFVESDWHYAFNAMINNFRNAGAAAIFMDWIMQQGNRFLGEYEGGIAQQALNGQVPTGTFSEFLSRKTGMLSGSNMPTGLSAAAQALLGSGSKSSPSSGSKAPASTGGIASGSSAPAPQPGPGPLPADTPALSPSAGETPGLKPLSPQVQALLG